MKKLLQKLFNLHDVPELVFARERVKQLEKENQELGRELDQARQQLVSLYVRTPAVFTEAGRTRRNLERLLVLAGMGDNNPIWSAVLAYADEHADNERRCALLPDLTDAQRHFNAGRSSSAEDFAYALRDLRIKAELQARKA